MPWPSFCIRAWFWFRRLLRHKETNMSVLIEKTKDKKAVPLMDKNRSVISSYTHAVEFGTVPVLIGERINPTGKSALKAALRRMI